LGSVVAYWITLYVLQQWMKDKKPFTLKYISAAHNLIMTLVSLWLALGIGYQMLKTYRNYGLYASYCGVNREWDNQLGFWVNWFYLSKYYEFVDTIILVLKKRELGRLHVIHHSITGIISWLAMDAEIIMGWITAFNNSVIHVFMYWYYFKQTLGYTVWWKKYLTSGQIVQFVIDTTTSYPFLYLWLTGQPCRGNMTSWVCANIGVYTSGNESRMGKGKGSFDYWCARVAVSKIIFELRGDIHEQVVRDAMRLAGNKMPGMYEFVRKGDPAVMGITKVGNGVTEAMLKRPRKPTEGISLDTSANRLRAASPGLTEMPGTIGARPEA